jgi:hypothetical protein
MSTAVFSYAAVSAAISLVARERLIKPRKRTVSAPAWARA